MSAYTLLLERVIAEGRYPPENAGRVARALTTYAGHAGVPADEILRLLPCMTIKELTEYLYREVLPPNRPD